MNYIDYIIIALLVIFFWKGFRLGFIGSIGWLIGLIVGTWLAGHYYQQVAVWINSWMHHESLSTIVAFVGVLLLSMIVVGSVLLMVNKIFNLIPLVGIVNRFLGGVIGLIEVVILIGLFIWFVGLLPFTNGFSQSLEQAKLRQPLIQASALVRWVLPQALKASQKINFQDLGFPQTTNFSADDFINKLSPEQLEIVKDKLKGN